MPEYTISELEGLLSKIANEDVRRKWSEFIAKMKEAGDQSVELTEVSQDMAKALVDASAAGSAMGDAITLALAKVGAGFNVLSALIDTNRERAIGMGIATAVVFERLFLDVLPSGNEAFGSMAEAGVSAGSSIYKSFETIRKPLTALISTIPIVRDRAQDVAAGFGRIAQSVDAVISMERNIVRLAAASGDMQSVMGRGAQIFTDLTTAAATYVEQVGEASLATGISTDVVSKYADALGTAVPGALRSMISLGEKGRGSMSELAAGLKIASAFQIDYNQVIEDSKLAYRELGTTGQGALQMIAGMAIAAKESGLPMDTMRTYVLETARSFKMFGDNAQGAIAILSGMRGALKDSGMGPEAIRELVSGMTSGIRDMDVAHKAFVSAQTGGRGGLAGAFEMDYLLSKGKTEEVMSRTMTAMQRQFGGPVVTLEDVQRTPALAGQLMKQVSFLTDVAGIAKDQASAYRILEGMKRGAPEMVAEARKPPEERLQTAVEMGHDLQKQGNTFLKQIETHTKIAAMTGAIIAKKEFGGAIGVGTEGGMEAARERMGTIARAEEGVTVSPEMMVRHYAGEAERMTRGLVGEGGGVRAIAEQMGTAAQDMLRRTAFGAGAAIGTRGEVTVPGATPAPAGPPGAPGAPGAPATPGMGEAAAEAARAAAGTGMSIFRAIRETAMGPTIEGPALPTPAEALRPYAEGAPAGGAAPGASMFELPPLAGNVTFDVRISDEYMREIARQEIDAEIENGNIAAAIGSRST